MLRLNINVHTVLTFPNRLEVFVYRTEWFLEVRLWVGVHGSSNEQLQKIFL